MAVDEVSASDVGQHYLELHHRLRRTVDEAMAATGVSMSRAKVLNELAVHGSMNQSALAARLGFAPRSITDTVDALERDHLAARSSDPKDRRAWIVEITPAGSLALERAMAAKHKAMDQIFGALDAPARAEFVALLSSIGASLTSPPGGCFVE
jgi:DNA-binding MarR family transcriptional regulator